MNYIVIIVLSIVLIVSGYYIFNIKNSSDTGQSGSPDNKCQYGTDEKGNCIVPEQCGGIDKPLTTCEDNQELVCDKNFSTPLWRCKLNCESDTNPFPYGFANCQPDQIKCDSNGKYYCDSDYCKNGGILYSGNTKCSCDPTKFIGDKCECDISKCKGGIADPLTCNCISCCNSDTIATLGNKKVCKYYGDNCENNCELDNYVFDESQNICVCPDGYELEGKNCKPIDCGPNGTLSNNKCICTPNSGFTGDRCNIPLCGNNGRWNPSTQMCDCDKDQNGKPLAAGDRCQYSRKGLCNGNGYPVVENGKPSCNCDPIYSGDHCTCITSKKPDSDDCKGKFAECKETNATNDDNRTGNWIASYLSCGKINDYYQGNDKWIEQCTSYIAGDANIKPPAYSAVCKPKLPQPESGEINDFYYGKTCNATPTEADLSKCRQGLNKYGQPLNPPAPQGGCYIATDHTDSSTITGNNSYCGCEYDSNNLKTDYYCKPITSVNDCGPMPPSGYCYSGGKVKDPICFNYEDGRYAYVCQSSNLPQDYIQSHFKLNKNNLNDGNSWWYSTTDNNSVFPSINMDQCISYNEKGIKNGISLYTTLDTPEYQQGWKNLNPQSAYGYVYGFDKPQQTFYYPNDPNIIVYNHYNPKISIDGTKISDGSSAYPSLYDTLNNGCASFRTPYDQSKGDIQSSCAVNPDGSSRGYFQQLCADTNRNILKDKDGNYICNDICTINNNGEKICNKPTYVTNTGRCSCNTYHSIPQNNDYAHYKGKFCQYDDTMCNNKGLIDDNGKCECLTYYSNSQKKNVTYIGYNDKVCLYGDNDNCNGLGIAKLAPDGYQFCDYSVLKDLTKYSLLSDIKTLKNGDVIIIEKVDINQSIVDNKLVYNIIPTNLFIGIKENMEAPTTVQSDPTVFKLEQDSDIPSFKFKTLNTRNTSTNINDLLDGMPYFYTDINDSTYYSQFDNNKPSYFSYQITPTPTDSINITLDYQLYQISSGAGGHLICNSNNELKPPMTLSYWRIYKF